MASLVLWFSEARKLVALNDAIPACRGEIILFLDSDIVVTCTTAREPILDADDLPAPLRPASAELVR